MPECAFKDLSSSPVEADLQPVLGEVWEVWKGFLDFLQERYQPVALEWKLMKSGWTLLPKQKMRTICYLFPAKNEFTAAFVLGEKAVEAARKSQLPRSVLDEIENARPYVEGRGIQVRVVDQQNLATLEELVRLKLAKY